MTKNLLRQAAKNHKAEILQPYDALMDLKGFEFIYTLCDYFGGSTVYIPQVRSIFQRCLELDAIKEYDGYNIKALTRKYGLSESHLRRLVGKK